MVMPMTSCPASTIMAAVTELSTPPLIAMRIFDMGLFPVFLFRADRGLARDSRALRATEGF